MQDNHATKKITWLKAAIGIALLGLLVAAVMLTGFRHYVLTSQGRWQLQHSLRGFIEGLGFWGDGLFFLLWTVGCLFLLPATIFTGLGALLYGKYLSIPMNIVGALLGGAAAFIGSRYLFRDSARHLVGTHLEKWDARLSKNGVWVVMWMRLCALPYPLVNFIAALTRVSFKDFMLGTALSVVPSMGYISYTIGSVSELAFENRSLWNFLREDAWVLGLGLVFYMSLPYLFKFVGKRWGKLDA